MELLFFSIEKSFSNLNDTRGLEKLLANTLDSREGGFTAISSKSKETKTSKMKSEVNPVRDVAAIDKIIKDCNKTFVRNTEFK